jgi:hypothetical protein
MNDPQLTAEEATEALQKAIADHAIAHGIADTDAYMLGDWAVVANWTPVDGDVDSTYSVAYHRNKVPNHVAVGLFQTGMDIAQNRYEEQ